MSSMLSACRVISFLAVAPWHALDPKQYLISGACPCLVLLCWCLWLNMSSPAAPLSVVVYYETGWSEAYIHYKGEDDK